MDKIMKGRHLTSGRSRADGTYARFVHSPEGQPIPRQQAALSSAHAAHHERRTVYQKRVFDAGELQRVLVSGKNNSKIGARCEVGAWAGMPIFYVTLEERATCPVDCFNWDTCYGNALPMAARVRYDAKFIMSLAAELDYLAWEHLGGFIVRLHMLGDFPEIGYLRWWHQRLREYPSLRIWGYTAHKPGTPIGDATWALNHAMPGRVAIRNSVRADAEPDTWQATTVWDRIEGRWAGGGIVCPAEIPRAAGAITCGRCGLCWKSELAKTRISFLGHGMGSRDQPRISRYALPALPAASPLVKFLVRPDRRDPELDALVQTAIVAGKVTELPQKKTPTYIKTRD